MRPQSDATGRQAALDGIDCHDVMRTAPAGSGDQPRIHDLEEVRVTIENSTLGTSSI
jgi:hypothetical protein